jgi:hypothetical protein
MSNDKQTAEEAAREYGTLYYFDKDGNRKEAGTDPKKEKSFLAGVQWTQEREKVLWTGWVQVDHDGKVVDPDSPIVDIEPWEVGKYVRVNIVEVPE